MICCLVSECWFYHDAPRHNTSGSPTAQERTLQKSREQPRSTGALLVLRAVSEHWESPKENQWPPVTLLWSETWQLNTPNASAQLCCRTGTQHVRQSCTGEENIAFVCWKRTLNFCVHAAAFRLLWVINICFRNPSSTTIVQQSYIHAKRVTSSYCKTYIGRNIKKKNAPSTDRRLITKPWYSRGKFHSSSVTAEFWLWLFETLQSKKWIEIKSAKQNLTYKPLCINENLYQHSCPEKHKWSLISLFQYTLNIQSQTGTYFTFKYIYSSVLFDDPFHVTSGKDKGMWKFFLCFIP